MYLTSAGHCNMSGFASRLVDKYTRGLFAFISIGYLFCIGLISFSVYEFPSTKTRDIFQTDATVSLFSVENYN